MESLSSRIRFLDPMRRDYRGRENQQGIATEIVRGDMADLECSDVIIANCPRPSWGTAMELFYAGHSLHKKIVIIHDGNKPSPWLIRWAYAVVPSVEAAVEVALSYVKVNDTPQRLWFVYLAGAINACSDSECRDWRSEVQKLTEAATCSK